MGEDLILDEKTVRIVDLLDQLKRVNEMISMHQSYEEGDFMAAQYERQKLQFVNELKKLFSDFDLTLDIKSKAA